MMKCKICDRAADEKKEFCDICYRIIEILKNYTNIYKSPST